MICSESQTCIQSEWTLKHYFVAYLCPHLYCQYHLILKSYATILQVAHLQFFILVKHHPKNIWSIWDHLGASKFQARGTTTLWSAVVKPFFSKAINKHQLTLDTCVCFSKLGYPKPLVFPLNTTEVTCFLFPSRTYSTPRKSNIAMDNGLLIDDCHCDLPI